MEISFIHMQMNQNLRISYERLRTRTRFAETEAKGNSEIAYSITRELSMTQLVGLNSEDGTYKKVVLED